MEILFITHKYPPMTGGMEKQSYELLKGMSEFSKVHTIAYSGQGNKLLFFLKLRSRINKILRDSPGIKVVHFNDGVMAQIGLLVYHWKGLKTTATFHGLDIVFPNQIFRKYLVPRFKRLDHIICVSRYTARITSDLLNQNQDISVIHNGIDHDLTQYEPSADSIFSIEKKLSHLKPNTKILLSIGRAVKRKGFGWFIKNVLSRLPDSYHYVIIGPLQQRKGALRLIYDILPGSWRRQLNLFLGWADDSEQITTLLSKPKYNKKATHLGKVPYDELVMMLQKCNALVMPNIDISGDAEGFGLVALEANMKKKMVFASDLQGVKDAVVHSKNGILLPSGDSNAWIDGISSRSILPEMEEKAYQYAIETFSWKKMVNEYYDLFSSLRDQNVPHNKSWVTENLAATR